MKKIVAASYFHKWDSKDERSGTACRAECLTLEVVSIGLDYMDVAYGINDTLFYQLHIDKVCSV